MNDALRVRSGQRAGDLSPDGDDALGRERLPLEEHRKVLPLDVLHDDEGAAVVLEHVVDRRDVRMADARGRAGFVDDSRAQALDARRGREEAFQRDEPIEARIAPEKHLAHASLAEPVQDDVGTNVGSSGKIGVPVARRRWRSRAAPDQRRHGVTQRRIHAVLAQELLACVYRLAARGCDELLRLEPAWIHVAGASGRPVADSIAVPATL
jgi:hypothetical protein